MVSVGSQLRAKLLLVSYQRVIGIIARLGHQDGGLSGGPVVL